MKIVKIIIVSVVIWQASQAQDSTAGRKYDLLPVITYAAESALNLGAIGFKYFDLSKENKNIPVSFLNVAAIYTTRNQLFLESGYQFFLSNADRLNGRFYYFNAPDRNYGLGNNPNLRILENDTQELLNYLNVDVTRIGFMANYQKKIAGKLFFGPSVKIEDVIKYDTIPNSFEVLQDARKIDRLQNRTEGRRVGVGFTVTHDTRDQVINSRTGHFFESSFLLHSKIFASDFEYVAIRTEFIKYLNPFKNHTLAFRIIQDWKYPNRNGGNVPLYGLSRPNGRGYFQGTFQDQHSQQIDMEYRLPFWRDTDMEYPRFHFWKGLGAVFFISGQQAFGETGPYRVSNTNLALGTGLRVLFNKKNRMNLRVDFAYGLLENGNGINGRQTTFSFNLSEAF